MASRPAPFLTAEQQAQLDAALAAKAAEQQKAKQQLHYAKTISNGAHKTKGASAKVGGPKKGGAGGKYTWGALLTEGAEDSGSLDPNDPNYSSEDDLAAGNGKGGHVVLRSERQGRLAAEVEAYKEGVRTIVEEYFASGDIGDVADSLEELGSAVGGPAEHLAHYFVKRLITLALDRKDREREMASVLLSSLYAEVLSGEQIAKGFWSLVDGLEDTVLDVPDAPGVLAKFMARAVVDDVLPPAIASRIPDTPGTAAADLRHKLEALLSARHRHSAEAVLRCWGAAGAGVSYPDTKAAIAALLQEYAASLDAEEARTCLHKLAVPFFHHELVKQALVMGLEHPQRQQPLVNLLARLSEVGEVSYSQLTKGLQRCRDNLADMALDNPQARERFKEMMEVASQARLFDDPDAASGAQSPASRSSSVGGGLSAAGASGATGPIAPPAGVTAFKQQCVTSLREYFDSQDAEEVGRRLQVLDEPGLAHLFVKAALSLALDRRDRERELVSNLLAKLHPEVIPPDQVATGFSRFLNALDDLVLDCPDALRLGGLFLARAVVDEVLPPNFLAQVLSSLDHDSLGVSAVKAAGQLLSARHGAEHVANCFNGGATGGLDAVRAQIRAALREFLTSADVDEVARCLGELGVAPFHHEVVLVAAELSFERYHSSDSSNGTANGSSSGAVSDVEAAAAPLVQLLGALHARGVLNQTQMGLGFQRVAAALKDEVMDYGPAAQNVFDWMHSQAVANKWLPTEP